MLAETRCVALSGGRSGADGDIWVIPPSAEEMIVQALSAQREGRAAAAVELLRRAATLEPGSAIIANHLGNALQDAGDQTAAIEAYRHAVTADASFAPALQNLGYLLIGQGRISEGTDHLRRAHDIQPREVNRVMLATALPVVYADHEELRNARSRIETEVRALADDGLQVDTRATLSPTNFFAAYQGSNDRDVQADLGRIYRGVQPARRPSGRNRPAVGLLSAYFRDHTIGRLNLGRVQRLPRSDFDVVVLSANAATDSTARAFEAAADRFVRIPRDLATARALIADQELDLLLFTDVGMDALTYTLAFSRMAAVQCATWGHPVTTGSPAMDLFLSSDLLETPEADAHYTERLVRRPTLGTYYYRPERPEADRERLGLPPGPVYACPQTLFKFHPDFDALLAAILRGDPDGTLVLLEGHVANWTEILRARFARTMPDVTDRIRWLPSLPNEEYLRLLACSDVVLDPIHFGGGNSSYEALAMARRS